MLIHGRYAHHFANLEKKGKNQKSEPVAVGRLNVPRPCDSRQIIRNVGKGTYSRDIVVGNE